jgi:hypothetical protein
VQTNSSDKDRKQLCQKENEVRKEDAVSEKIGVWCVLVHSSTRKIFNHGIKKFSPLPYNLTFKYARFASVSMSLGGIGSESSCA